MAEKDVRAAVMAGAAVGTNATQIIGTPCEVHSWIVYNLEPSSNHGAAISLDSNSAGLVSQFTSYQPGATPVEAHGYELPEVWGSLAHTNMTLIVLYSPFQD